MKKTFVVCALLGVFGVFAMAQENSAAEPQPEKTEVQVTDDAPINTAVAQAVNTHSSQIANLQQTVGVLMNSMERFNMIVNELSKNESTKEAVAKAEKAWQEKVSETAALKQQLAEKDKKIAELERRLAEEKGNEEK